MVFNGEGKKSASHHVSDFNSFCDYIDLFDEVEKCRLFAATFTGRILIWFAAFPVKSIHSWEHFTKLFLNGHENYNYRKLGLELENLVDIKMNLLMISFPYLC